MAFTAVLRSLAYFHEKIDNFLYLSAGEAELFILFVDHVHHGNEKGLVFIVFLEGVLFHVILHETENLMLNVLDMK